MPNESSTEDVIERIIFIQKIEQGITDVQQNNVAYEDKIDYLIDEWSK